jgi:hypothetical protein
LCKWKSAHVPLKITYKLKHNQEIVTHHDSFLPNAFPGQEKYFNPLHHTAKPPANVYRLKYLSIYLPLTLSSNRAMENNCTARSFIFNILPPVS